MRLRWLAILIVLVAFAPKQVVGFCQAVTHAAMTVVDELAKATQ